MVAGNGNLSPEESVYLCREVSYFQARVDLEARKRPDAIPYASTAGEQGRKSREKRE